MHRSGFDRAMGNADKDRRCKSSLMSTTTHCKYFIFPRGPLGTTPWKFQDVLGVPRRLGTFPRRLGTFPRRLGILGDFFSKDFIFGSSSSPGVFDQVEKKK